MMFRKNANREAYEMLLNDLKEYESHTPMTKAERRELHDWISQGHSPYNNGYFYYDDSGHPLDFISAQRIVQKQLDDEATRFRPSLCSDADDDCLPF